VKRCALFLLLLLFLHHILGYHLWFGFTSLCHHAKITAMMEDEGPLMEIRLSGSQVDAVEFSSSGKEMRLDGMYYDIRSFRLENGEMVLSCFQDREEKERLNLLDVFLEEDDPTDEQGHPQKNKVKEGPKEFFIPASISIFLPAGAQSVRQVQEGLPASLSSELIIPPPEAVLS
jgi:hypothetical protein